MKDFCYGKNLYVYQKMAYLFICIDINLLREN